jgi:hypothetical protein
MANRSSNNRIFLDDPIRSPSAPPATDYQVHARDMGRRRRERDDRAGVFAEAQATAERDRRGVCLQRWPGILAAIRTLLAAYNDGAGEELLTAAEQSDGDDPAVTIASRRSARGTITIAVDGDALLVRTNPASSPEAAAHRIARRIDCSRSDLDTAAYILQNWMDQL